MTEGACLDSSVLIKIITPEEGSADATFIASQAGALFAPSFAWAEVGSTLRKKVRSKAIGADEAAGAWDAFLDLGVVFVQSEEVARRAWELAQELSLPTLYDAAFLAVAELAPGGPVPFWTADREFAGALVDRHPWIRLLA